MISKRWYLFLFFVQAVLSAYHSSLELLPSPPVEIMTLCADRTDFIGHLVSPLSGQLSLKVTDLVVIGAENLSLSRVYLLPPLALPVWAFEERERYLQEQKYMLFLQRYFRGWIFCPQIYLERRPFERQIRFADPRGAIFVFAYQENESQAKLVSEYGVSNLSEDSALGQFDVRNTRFAFENNTMRVFSPDGTTRIYVSSDSLLFLLEKEILPNGKIIRYFFQNNQLSRIESRDSTDTHIYASISLEGESHPLSGYLRDHPKKKVCGRIKNTNVGKIAELHFYIYPEYLISKAQSSTGQVATYTYKPQTYSNKSRTACGTFKYDLTLPFPLETAYTPEDRQERGVYQNFRLTAYSRKDLHFECSYADYQVKSLRLPVGAQGEMEEVYTMSYEIPSQGKKGGKTTVHRADGISMEYLISAELLLDAILYRDRAGKLQKEKRYFWDERHRLCALEMKDEEGRLFYRKTFEDYDSFGNPRLEKWIGDPSGKGVEEEQITKKEYEKHRLKREECEGKIYLYEYFKETHLLTAKYTRDQERLLQREFWEYDDFSNLKEHTLDDGTSEDRHNLKGVTVRKITRYFLRQEPPFLHLPESIEELYWDGQQEQLLKKVELLYDRWGHVAEQKVYGSDRTFAYQIKREYDERGQILSETNPLGDSSRSTYTQKAELETTLSFSGNLRTKRTYDAKGRLKILEQADLKTGETQQTHYKYDSFDRCTQKIDYLGRVTQFTYDPLSSELVQTSGPPLLSLDREPNEVISHTEVDALGRKKKYTDANGHTTSYRYNAYGSLVEVFHPQGSRETFCYEKNGQLKSHIDPDGLTTAFTYDLWHRPLEKVYLFNEVVIAKEKWTYDAFNVKTYTDKEGHETQYEYDGAGRKVSETTSGLTTSFAYDRLGRLTAIHKEEGLSIFYERDFLDRILSERKEDHRGKILQKVDYTWDVDGRLESITRYPHGQKAKESFVYDAFGRLIQREDALGGKTTFLYQTTPLGFLEAKALVVEKIDPNWIVTKSTYDPYDRLSLLEIGHSYRQEKIYDALGQLLEVAEGPLVNRYEYGELGHLKTHIHAFGSLDARITKYVYSPAGKLLAKTLPDGTLLAHTYTPFGYLRTSASSDGSILQRYEYSPNGHLLYAVEGENRIKRQVDECGNIIREEINGLAYTCTYDRLNRLKKLTLPDQSSLIYHYDPLYLRAVIRLSAEEKMLYAHFYENYDLAGNLTSEQLIQNIGTVLHTWQADGKLQSLKSPYSHQTMHYDRAGRLTDISTESHYTYDESSRLIREELAGKTFSYTYDSQGKRTQKSEHLTGDNLLDKSPEPPFSLNGNPKRYAYFNLEYDALNRLKKAKNQEIEISFAYDALGRCISQNKNGHEERYFYYQDQEIGSFYPDGSIKELKVLGLHQRPIALELQGKLFAPLCDHQGTIRRLVDVGRQALQTFDSTAFGEELASSSFASPWRYLAKRYLPDLDLYLWGSGFYSPSTGRCLNFIWAKEEGSSTGPE